MLHQSRNMPRPSRCSHLTAPSRRPLHSFPIARQVRRRPNTFFSPSLSRQRTFTQKPSLLLISRSSVRPQLPFLHPFANPQSLNAASKVHRFISTETRVRWWRDIKIALRNTLLFGIGAGLLYLVSIGIKQTKAENNYPTPHEWTFWSRWYKRSAQTISSQEEADADGRIINWKVVGWTYQKVLERLENEAIDGTNLLMGETLVEGVGRTGYDIGMKSEPWRRGYYEALMGAGRAAEHLEGMAKRKGEERGQLYPWSSIPGPQNPRPKPMPWDRNGAYKNVPSEEECEDAYPQPEVYYMKILTTRGFDTGQRLDAALAYADWCDFKGLTDTAANMYDWAMDIAVSGLPTDAGNVIDLKSGVINNGKDEFVTQNLFKTTTALAVHHARTGNVKDALPIFLSVLRARKSLPAEAPNNLRSQRSSPADSDSWDYLESLKRTFIDTPYPTPPPSGDARPHHTLKEACEEIGLMTYIGEILFATSDSQKEKGLSWTRDSVDAAEAVLWVMDEQRSQDGRQRCRECLETGLKNWKAMTAQMTKLASRKKQEAEQSSGFLGTGLGRGSAISKASRDVERWREEESQIELRTQKTKPLLKPPQPKADGWSFF